MRRQLGNITFAALLTIIPLLSGCGLFFFPDYNGIHYVPSETNAVLPEDEYPRISFDFAVDTYSVEQLFTLSDFKGKIDGRYDWSEKTLRFIPNEEFIPGRRYVFVFSGKFRDKKGRLYTVDKEIVFFYADREVSTPAILNITPSPDSTITGTTDIVVRFSLPMDPLSIREGFEIVPETEYDYRWEDSNQVLTITPDEMWNNLTLYHFTFNTELNSATEIPMTEKIEGLYYVENDTTAPTVLYTACAENDWSTTPPFPVLGTDLNYLMYTDAIRICFSETMDKASVEDAFSLDPSCAGSLFWIDNPSAEYPDRADLVFIPETGYEMDQSYLLKIDESACDVSQTQFGTTYRESFTPNIPVIELSSIEGSAAGDSFTLNNGDYSTVTAQSIHSSEPSPFKYTFSFTFSSVFSSDAEKAAVQDEISISEIFSSDGSPSPVLYAWPDNYTCVVTYENFTESSTAEHYYLIEVSGGSSGVRNNAGSYLPETIEQLLVVPIP